MPARTGSNPNGGTSYVPVIDRYAVLKERMRKRRRRGAMGGGVGMAGNQTGLSGNQQPGFGDQLTRLVDRGDFSQQRAQKVANERQLLEETYGPNWREQILGGAGEIRHLRQQLQANPDQGKEIRTQLDALLAKRRKAVEDARTKVARRYSQRFAEGGG